MYMYALILLAFQSLSIYNKETASFYSDLVLPSDTLSLSLPIPQN